MDRNPLQHSRAWRHGNLEQGDVGIRRKEEETIMPWLVIYIGFLFPVALLLVVLATDWKERRHNQHRTSAPPISAHAPRANLP